MTNKKKMYLAAAVIVSCVAVALSPIVGLIVILQSVDAAWGRAHVGMSRSGFERSIGFLWSIDRVTVDDIPDFDHVSSEVVEGRELIRYRLLLPTAEFHVLYDESQYILWAISSYE